MRSAQSLVFLFLVGALITFSHANAINKEPKTLETREDDDACPSSRAVCTAGSGKSRFVRLATRMKLPGDSQFGNDLDAFMLKQTKAAKNVVTDDSKCTAVYSTLTDSEVAWAVKEMCGCTSLIVVSVKAIYFTHYFENLAFCGSPKHHSDFKGQVLKALDDGTDTQESLKLHASDFKNQDGLNAFIMTPTKETKEEIKPILYKDKIDKLQSKVKEIIGITPKIVLYDPEDCATSKDLGTNALGTALFQYDPRQNANDPKALSKVWVERSEEYSHAWSPSPAQENTFPLPQCAGVPGGPPQVAFPQADADSDIIKFCSNRAYWDVDIVPAVSVGTGLTSDGRSKALGATDSYSINNGVDNLWLSLSFSEDSCIGSFQFTYGANDDERLAHCVDRFRSILNGCNTDTMTDKFGGELNDVCALYRMTARSSDQADPLMLKSETDPGTFTCEPTDTSAIGGSSSSLAGTCTCWYSNFPGNRNVFKMPSSKDCRDTDKGALIIN